MSRDSARYGPGGPDTGVERPPGGRSEQPDRSEGPRTGRRARRRTSGDERAERSSGREPQAEHRHRHPEQERSRSARRWRARRRRGPGTESGISVMSPRLVTEETRPRCEGSIARTNAALSHTEAAPAVKPSTAIETTRVGFQPSPTHGDGQALHDQDPEARGRAVRRLPADGDHAADDGTGRQARVGDAEPVRAPARAAHAEGDAETGDRGDEDVEGGQPDHEQLRGLVAPQVAHAVARTCRASVRGWRAAAGSAGVRRARSTAAITAKVAASTSITTTSPPEATRIPPAGRAEQPHGPAADLVPALHRAEVATGDDLPDQRHPRRAA